MLFVVFTGPHIIYMSLDMYPEHVTHKVTLFVVIFMLLYLMLRFFYFMKFSVESPLVDLSEIRSEPKELVNIIVAIEIVCMLIILFYLYRRGGTLLNSVAYGDYEVSMIEQVARTVFVSLLGIGFVCLIRREFIKFGIIVACYMVYLIITQIRYNMVSFVVPFIIFFIFSTNRKKVVLGVGLGFFFIFFVYVFQQVRWLGGIGNLSEVGLETVVNRAVSYFKQGNGEVGLIKAFYYFVEHNNNFRDFGQGNGFIRLALIMLPASIFTFKPRDFAIDMYREWFSYDNPLGTMHPTLFGDAFANFGFAGCITGLFYAGLFIVADETINNEKYKTVSLLKASLCCTMAILIGRGALYNAVINMLLGIIVIYLVKRVCILVYMRRTLARGSISPL